MPAVCGDHRVEPTVTITKNAAQACDVGVGQGTQRRRNLRNRALGRRPFVKGTPRRARVFPIGGTRWAEQMAGITHSGS
jgi:hypothetical protein